MINDAEIFGFYLEALAIRNRGYTNEVHLRGLRNKIFIPRAGGFCLCMHEFDLPSAIIDTYSASGY
ncbi:MAG: hypothetical protein EA343_22340 [Nodularia sp. (in: Bacteria)]|nr:MAG: hypothetical protein EA343_22340 [Nodularia sp. (in: cyanobacteria)]